MILSSYTIIQAEYCSRGVKVHQADELDLACDYSISLG